MAYRGKYPNRIKAVYSVEKRICVETNDGRRWFIDPVTPYGRSNMPKLGIDVTEYTYSEHYRCVMRFTR
jgi:hypothetical protein